MTTLGQTKTSTAITMYELHGNTIHITKNMFSRGEWHKVAHITREATSKTIEFIKYLCN